MNSERQGFREVGTLGGVEGLELLREGISPLIDASNGVEIDGHVLVLHFGGCMRALLRLPALGDACAEFLGTFTIAVTVSFHC